ncbi:hypothetical protein A3SI_10479 [Nitritalea halalkaliphila LW7]|uniref:Uncharacterized protein n=1 Tax=Nitritalea halalkaliphila LW7 TaxID=1189621 RepID=I5C3N0_9BACT|nr:hypothetical protein [Nitritalea halalkaliphila]EIM76432.1 hypothetical protein A3SI_10479 [Nitritalea halalkaliphila LW7]
MYNSIRYSLFFFLFLIVCACYQTEEETPVLEEPEEVQLMGTLTLGNVGARAYLFTAIEGDGITAELEEENADLTLVIGGRYTVINGAGPHIHFVC